MNWGHKIAIVFIVFAAGMLTLVTKSMRARIDMVTPDYYSEELKYQQVIDGRNNADALSAPVSIAQPGDSIIITLPQELRGRALSGTIRFYRPSDSRRDFELPLQPDANGRQRVGRERFIRGAYKVKLQWTMNDKAYYQEQSFHIN
ncbi:FixH family protein [Chitinophaga vietnamensis]|uniref:FixH family protein n=1 Tax=Chitinophaga vietnamensis TaxID=2593957 RepID=UPI001177891D|nr:FixH family protein [Chitinophaga vietnamensis]